MTSLTKSQKLAMEQLVENESLTDNLTDPQAQAVLDWAQKQILAKMDIALVTQAVSAANSSGETNADALVAAAEQALEGPNSAKAKQKPSAQIDTQIAGTGAQAKPSKSLKSSNAIPPSGKRVKGAKIQPGKKAKKK